ncbi:MAG TPA: hypothetical protein PKA41_08770 [Verrucomicrobiota bacterium]|nr:hypothetical protein [Verrucomicrobiota bacterium]
MATEINKPTPVFTAGYSLPPGDEKQVTVTLSSPAQTGSDVELEPPVSEFAGKVHDRANAVTTVLTHILESQSAVRRWGINE